MSTENLVISILRIARDALPRNYSLDSFTLSRAEAVGVLLNDIIYYMSHHDMDRNLEWRNIHEFFSEITKDEI